MAEGCTLMFRDPDGYAAAFGDTRIKFKITGAGDCKARLIRLKMNQLEAYWCSEGLPRIAYISLPSERIPLSLPVGRSSLTCEGVTLQNGDLVLHGRGQRVHQRSYGVCQWGLIIIIARAARALRQGVDRTRNPIVTRNQNIPPCARGDIEIPGYS
jgi:hypothetical protein